MLARLLALAKKDCAGARHAFEQVGDKSGLALVALAEERYDDAEALFAEAHDQHGLGLVALARRDFSKAIECFRSVNDAGGLGYAYMSQGDWKIAEHFFRCINDWNGLGDLHVQMQNFALARECFERDSNPVKVIQSFRNDYRLANPREEALSYGNGAVQAGQMVPECLMELADVLYEMRRIDDAVAYLDQAAAYDGYASEAHLRKGRILFYRRDLAGAKREFEAVAANDLAPANCAVEARESIATVNDYIARKLAGRIPPSATL